jgi:hypothetical protein
MRQRQDTRRKSSAPLASAAASASSLPTTLSPEQMELEYMEQKGFRDQAELYQSLAQLQDHTVVDHIFAAHSSDVGLRPPGQRASRAGNRISLRYA